jgi:outer membrane protein TolC
MADGQLPDPKLKLGLANFPTDTFSRTQEPMTQLQVGIVQMFPRGSSLGLKQRIGQEKAQHSRLMAGDTRRLTTRDVSQDWLDLYYWLQAEQTVSQSRDWFAKLIGITEARYRVGTASQQDVVQAELELARLTDRIEGIRLQQGRARAQLSRWIGDASTRPLPDALPSSVMPTLDGSVVQVLARHPRVQAEDAAISAGSTRVELARQAYKPGWALDVTYGGRDGYNVDGSERADFLSAKVLLDIPLFDIPLFTSKRQDQSLAASQQELEATRLEREDRLRQLASELQEARASVQVLERQIQLHKKKLIPQSAAHSSLALKAYENDRMEFDAVVRAHVMELETRLKALRLEVDRARSAATIVYLAGDEK